MNTHFFKKLICLGMIFSLTFIGLSGCGQKKTELVNVSYDATREFYKEYNRLFEDYWYGRTGEKVEKELLLDSKHVYLYVPAEGENYTNVVTHFVNAGIVVILALSKAADIKIDGAEVLAGWESEVDATTVDVAEFFKKNA